MAKELELDGHRYWIVSEPFASGWKARVLEVATDGGSDEVGIEATGETRGVADEGAERKLRRLLQVREPGY